MSFLQFIELLVTLTLMLSKHSTGETGKLLCFFDETVRFSTSNPNTYYECKPGQEYAVLKRCPPNEHYSSEKEICRPIKKKGRERRAATTSSKPLKILNYKLLNQDVRLGDFYDARSNEFLSGTSLWSPTVLRKIKKENRNHIGSFQYLYKTGKTTTDRLDIMDIKAELKLSFLGGLISVTGSAGFARKGDLTEIDETFTLAYKTVAYSATIPKSTPVSFNKYCKNADATHVVNKITYGQNAYFFFKHRLRKNEQSQAVYGSLEVVVKSIPNLAIEGKASVDLKGNLKEFSESSEVQYNGDFSLDNGIPSTFDSSVKTFQELPEKTAKAPDYKGAVPVEVQLTPLSEYCGPSNIILANIGSSAMTQVSNVLQDLEFLLMNIKGLLQSQPAVLYPAVRGNLEPYKSGLELFQLKFKGKLQVLLPAIRGRLNGKSETDLLRLLTEYKLSPFEKAKSLGYLLKRRREIKAITFFSEGINMAAQKNFQIADYKRANGVKLIINYRKVVILSVNILLSPKVTADFLAGKKIDESAFWYENNPSTGLLGYQRDLFKNFAMTNKNSKDTAYLIKITKRAAYPLDITAQTKGKSIPTPFVIPDKPLKPIDVSPYHNKIVIKVEKPRYNVAHNKKKVNTWVTKFYVEYWKWIDGRDKGMKKVLFDFSKTTTAIIKNLELFTKYQYRVVHYTEFGLSPPSEVGDVTTRPCSEPVNLKLTATEVETLSFSWDTPIEIGKGITIGGYKVTLYDGPKKHAEKTVSVKKVSFVNLNPSTKYVIKVVAISSKFKSLPAIMVAYTIPRPPHFLNLVKADLNAITFSWSPPKIAKGATIKEYVVKYVKMDYEGSKTIPGTEKSKSALKHTSIKITDLVQGTTYGFSVQVITILSGSELSKSRHSKYLVALTKFKISDLENMRDSMQKKFVNPLLHQLETKIRAEQQTQAQKMQQLYTISETQKGESQKLRQRSTNVETKQQGNLGRIHLLAGKLESIGKTEDYYINTFVHLSKTKFEEQDDLFNRIAHNLNKSFTTLYDYIKKLYALV